MCSLQQDMLACEAYLHCGTCTRCRVRSDAVVKLITLRGSFGVLSSNKRTTLTKRLLKARVRREHETTCEVEEESAVLKRTSLLLKRLKENQLEMLVEAVESRGADLSACVLLPRDPQPMDPHLLCCQIWRWPDLQQSEELKRLPVCRSAKDPVYICCNPYHWSRLCKPESPPPPYCRFVVTERLRPEDRAPSEAPYPGHHYPGSLTTYGEGENAGREWCKLAYWELATRVGRLFAVEPPSVNVFTSLPHGDGLCLATLAQHHSNNHSPPPPSHESVRRTRAKIGLGVTLSYEVDGVWAYNRSDGPIFVNSPTLEDPESRGPHVCRVPPGHCLNIFERSKAAAVQCRRHQLEQLAQTGPVDPNSVRISFAKGWGHNYSRQEVTACPCWLEVLLAPCR